MLKTDEGSRVGSLSVSCGTGNQSYLGEFNFKVHHIKL